MSSPLWIIPIVFIFLLLYFQSRRRKAVGVGSSVPVLSIVFLVCLIVHLILLNRLTEGIEKMTKIMEQRDVKEPAAGKLFPWDT